MTITAYRTCKIRFGLDMNTERLQNHIKHAVLVLIVDTHTGRVPKLSSRFVSVFADE